MSKLKVQKWPKHIFPVLLPARSVPFECAMSTGGFEIIETNQIRQFGSLGLKKWVSSFRIYLISWMMLKMLIVQYDS